MTDERIQRLEARLAQLEDEAAIGRLIASYGPLVDGGAADGAVAVCESILLMRRGDGYTVLRAGVNHFVLGRIEGRWQIRSRTTRTLNGDALPRELLAAGVAGRVR
jgi:hypothetical protein